MEADPTTLVRVPHAQPVTTSTCVHEALAQLHSTGAKGTVVVYRSVRPVGVVAAAALHRAAETGRAGAPITTVMDYVAVPVNPHADVHATVRTLTEAAWDWLRGRRA
jgi:predicted transcriptional regulator